MQAEYKRDVNHNYLILTGDKKIDTSSYQVRMLERNTIPSVLQCRLQGVNGDLRFCYDITSRQSVASYYEHKKINGEDLSVIFGGLITVVEEMSEYLMSPEQLLLAPEYIYLDAGKKEISFCYLPGYDHPVQEQFRELAEYFLPRLDHEDPEAVRLGYGVYRRTLETGFQLEGIKETVYRREERKDEEIDQKEQENCQIENEPDGNVLLWDDWAVNPSDQQKEKEDKKRKMADYKFFLCCGGGGLIVTVTAAAGFLGYLPPVQAEIVLAVFICILAVSVIVKWTKGKKKKKEQQSEQWREKVRRELEKEPEKSEILYPEKEDVQLEEKEDKEEKQEKESREPFCEQTVLLSQGNTTGPASLVSVEPGALATIYLEQELTVVGKMEQASDAVIPVDTVSRVHARIWCRDGEYYLTDMNSRNGTSVNGRMLKPEEEYLLQDEDHVDFAKARYIFLK